MCLRSFVDKTPDTKYLQRREFVYHSSGGWESMIMVLAVFVKVLSMTPREQKMHLLHPPEKQILCLVVNEGIEGKKSPGLVHLCVFT